MALSVEYLVVGGAGVGGDARSNGQGAGGGGAGQVVGGSTTLNPGAYAIAVGQTGNPGTASGALGVTAQGGGAGGGFGSDATERSGHPGASGGGGATPDGNGGGATAAYPGGPTSGGAGGGGGGAGGAGGTGTGGGNGGGGVGSSISGTFVVYGGGGGGGNVVGGASGGVGGSGVGGTGAGDTFGASAPTTPGSGGGGSASSNPPTNGAAGIVIIRYLGGAVATGGAISSAAGYTIHTFTGDDTFTFAQAAPVLDSIVPTFGYRNENTYVNFYGSNFTPDSTIVPYTNGGMSLASGLIFGSSTNVAVWVNLTAGAALGGNHLLAVANAGGQSAWALFSAYDRPPHIDQIDNTTLPGTYDTTFVRGTTPYTHFWGSYLYYGGITGTVSGTGVTVSPAADGGPSIIALYLAVAADAPLGDRTLYLTTTGGGNSNAVTITIVPQVPTLTSVTTAEGGPAQGFIGITERVVLNGTAFVPGATVNVSGGITVSNVVVQSETTITADFTGTALGTYSVSVTTSGGTTAVQNFTVIAVTVLSSGGMLVNQITGPQRQDFYGALGVRFTPTRDRLVTHLGRFKVVGNTGFHTIVLRDDTWATIAEKTVQLSTGTDDQWTYLQLSPPVVVKAGRTYRLTDDSIAYLGTDKWLGISPVATDGSVTVNGPVVEIAAMSGFTAGATRSDSYSVGFKFTAVGAYWVSMLGLWKMATNVLSHRIVLKDAAGTILRTATVDFTGGKGIVSKHNYVAVSPYLLTAGASYYLLADESGSEEWPDNSPNGVATWGGITIPSACFEAYPATSGVVPTVGGTTNSMWGAPGMLLLLQDGNGYAEAYVTTNLKLAETQQIAMLI